MCVLLGLIFVYQVNVSASPDPVSGLLACSDNMFVHNNSKHGRKSRKVDSTYGEFWLFKVFLFCPQDVYVQWI